MSTNGLSKDPTTNLALSQQIMRHAQEHGAEATVKLLCRSLLALSVFSGLRGGSFVDDHVGAVDVTVYTKESKRAKTH